MECVLVTFKQRHMRVHTRTLHASKRLGHERCKHALLHRDLFHDETERHDVVGHRECVGVTQINFVLTRCIFVKRVLNRNAHCFKNKQRARAKVTRNVGRGEVEVRTGVERNERLRRIALGEVEELHLGGGHE